MMYFNYALGRKATELKMGKYDITAEEVSKVISLDPETGTLKWKYRDISMFSEPKSHRLWNHKHAGKEAFTFSNHKGYKVGNLFSRNYTAHSVVWLLTHGVWPSNVGMQIDHINGDTSDNRPCNLRLVSGAENARNKSISKMNKSGVTGVTLDKQSGKWKAHIHINGKQVTIGRYKDKREAIKARLTSQAQNGYHENHGRNGNQTSVG